MTTIAFPTLSFADASAVDIGLKANTQVFVSDLSGYAQTLELPGARWTLSFAFPPLRRQDARLLAAFLAQLRGQANRARVPVWGRKSPVGTWAGAGSVNGGSQTGAQLVTHGFTAGATVKAGDFFNVGTNGELKVVTQDGAADGGGNLTVSFEPPLRASPADGTALVFSSPVVPLMIPQDPHLIYSLGEADLAAFRFDLVEVFA